MKQSDPYIDVRIPFEPGKQLGFAYNRAMQTVADWTLFLDHDILLSLNPAWYAICQKTIRRLGHTAGFITCLTNRISNSHQQHITPGDDIQKHIATADALYTTHNDTLSHKTLKDSPFSGFFILTHKQAWKDAAGFTDGFLGVDNAYYRDVINAGYQAYVLPGLYVYHIYRRRSGL